MGPNIIFDKSALEMLSIDESCWLDAHFLTNITPLFYVECLADLEKTPKSGKSLRTAEDIVGEIATKTPSMGFYPNLNHQTLIEADLLGNKVEMSNRVVLPAGQTKQGPDGKIGIHYKQFPEVEAMQRWQRGDFLEIESKIAKYWRNSLSGLNFDLQIAWVKNIIPTGKKFKTLEEIKEFADNFVKGKDKETYELALYLLNIPENKRGIILKKQAIDNKSFEEFAPYASFCFKVDLLFYLALHFNLISKERPSNRVDISYLYYLPFCMVFVSNDKLHKKVVPLFLNERQSFVDGKNFKVGLAELDKHYSQLPEDVKAQGVMKFALYPPVDVKNIATDLWDKHMKQNWRDDAIEKKNKKDDLPRDKEIVRKINEQIKNSKPIKPDGISADKADYTILEHTVLPTKGKWRIVSKEIEESKKED